MVGRRKEGREEGGRAGWAGSREGQKERGTNYRKGFPESSNQKRRQLRDLEKILENHTSDKSLIYRTYRE
jgi:hypothetical protein